MATVGLLMVCWSALHVALGPSEKRSVFALSISSVASWLHYIINVSVSSCLSDVMSDGVITILCRWTRIVTVLCSIAICLT